MAARDRVELAERFRLPHVGSSNRDFLTAVKGLLASAEEQREALVAVGMAPTLLEELARREAARSLQEMHQAGGEVGGGTSVCSPASLTLRNARRLRSPMAETFIQTCVQMLTRWVRNPLAGGI